MTTDTLSELQQASILSLFPAGTQIKEATYFRREYLPCPLRVCVSLPDGGSQDVVLRLSRRPTGVEREAALLPVLAQLGLSVPQLLAGPICDNCSGNREYFTVLSLLPGENLQAWSRASPEGLETAGRLVIEAVRRLHQLTASLIHHRAASDLPRNSMETELDYLLNTGSAWTDEPLFMEAVNSLKPIVASMETPLCFSNGDYQPGNFLSDGKELTGFLDFESACFEDPHIGIAKYRIYNMHPLNEAGFVERYLHANDLSEHDFAPRLAVRSLWTLQREVAVPEKSGEYGTHIVKLLYGALKLLNR